MLCWTWHGRKIPSHEIIFVPAKLRLTADGYPSNHSFVNLCKGILQHAPASLWCWCCVLDPELSWEACVTSIYICLTFWGVARGLASLWSCPMKPNISRGEQVSARVRWRIRWHVSGNFGYQRDHKLGVMFSSQTYSNQQIDLQFGKGGGYLDDVFNLNSSGHQVKTSKKNHLGKKKSHDPDPRLEVLSPSLYIYIYDP